MGRNKLDDRVRKDKHMVLLVSSEDLEYIDNQARGEGLNRSAWIRRKLGLKKSWYTEGPVQ